jgi:hypothetical protein
MNLTEILTLVNIIISSVMPFMAAFCLSIRRSSCCGAVMEREVVIDHEVIPPHPPEKTNEQLSTHL